MLYNRYSYHSLTHGDAESEAQREHGQTFADSLLPLAHALASCPPAQKFGRYLIYLILVWFSMVRVLTAFKAGYIPDGVPLAEAYQQQH